MHQKGIYLISIDEKTGIQAIERAEPNLPMRPNSPEKREHEYVRHGTQCLIANLEIGTGKIVAPMVSSTRKNDDFLSNVKNLIVLDPSAEWIFIADQLNTHKSEELVRFIAREINFKGDLGKTGHHGSGILKSMNTRMNFLENIASFHKLRENHLDMDYICQKNFEILKESCKYRRKFSIQFQKNSKIKFFCQEHSEMNLKL